MNFDTLLAIGDLFGFRTIASPLLTPKPKLELSPGAPVSDQFREEMNQWLLDRFGRHPEQAIQTPLGLFVSPHIYDLLKKP